jgi:hypothetical protein
MLKYLRKKIERRAGAVSANVVNYWDYTPNFFSTQGITSSCTVLSEVMSNVLPA